MRDAPRYDNYFHLCFCGASLLAAGGRRADTPMPVRESEALILRSFPLGEADKLVSFLSRSEGRLRGVASGARRPKSRFGSTLEPFSYVRMWFYERETRELVRINQCELIESFFEAQRDYAVGRTHPRRKPSARRARATLRALKREPKRTVSSKALSRQARRSAQRRKAA